MSDKQQTQTFNTYGLPISRNAPPMPKVAAPKSECGNALGAMTVDFERDFAGLDFSKDVQGRYFDPQTRYTFKLYPPLWERQQRLKADSAQATLF